MVDRLAAQPPNPQAPQQQDGALPCSAWVSKRKLQLLLCLSKLPTCCPVLATCTHAACPVFPCEGFEPNQHHICSLHLPCVSTHHGELLPTLSVSLFALSHLPASPTSGSLPTHLPLSCFTALRRPPLCVHGGRCPARRACTSPGPACPPPLQHCHNFCICRPLLTLYRLRPAQVSTTNLPCPGL